MLNFSLMISIFELKDCINLNPSAKRGKDKKELRTNKERRGGQ